MLDIAKGKYWGESWNPIKVIVDGVKWGYHCTKTSRGCKFCWAESINKRFYNGIPYDSRKVEYVLDEKVLEKPLHWKKPKVIFVCDLMDLFHEQVPFEFIDRIFEMMAAAKQHTFLPLTKRPEIMSKWYRTTHYLGGGDWLRNVYNGLTICNQEEADRKLPEFLEVPGHKWLSLEPLLSGINLKLLDHIDFPAWEKEGFCRDESIELAHHPIKSVIVGSESGHNARPMKLKWAIDIVEQCKDAGIPVFIKQLHINNKLSKDMSKWPEELRVRELPWEG